MSIIGSNVIAGASGNQGYNLNNSLRFRQSASAYLSRTPASATNRTTWTLSAWVKRGTLGTEQIVFNAGTTGSSDIDIFFTSDQFMISDRSGFNVKTTQVFRDPSAWYHFVVYFDTTQATSTNRIKLYVNGSQITDTAAGTSYPTQNATSSINNSVAHRIGTRSLIDNLYDGYMTEINFIDGTALTPSSFGETSTTTGTWIPKAYSSSYGTNGFYLKFADTSAATAAAIGKDSSGNGNNWTPSGISVTAGVTYDAMIDVPTNTSATVANYCVLNPLTNAGTLSGANLSLTTTSSGQSNTFGTIYVSSGKWYWEITSTADAAVGTMIGITDSSIAFASGGYYQSALGYGYYSQGGTKHNNSTSVAYGSSYTTNDVIGVALDMDAGTLTFYKNNTSQGTAFSSLTGLFAPAVCDGGTGSISVAANFGQRPFTYTPPSGYVALNTYNLPTPTILQGNKYMDATLYTGTGASLAITNAGAFQPDLVWVKGRSGATDHAWYDSVRGTTKQLESNTTTAETTETTGLTAFGTGGFTVGALAQMNTSAATYVGWQWKASNTTAVSGTGTGGVTSVTYSANTTAGFSIVQYTETSSSGTATHGLGIAPSFIITRDLAGANNWNCYHVSLGATKRIQLNSTAAADVQAGVWNNTAPTSSVFTLGSSLATAGAQIAYCFAEIAGFSKFGSYTGNNSTDGPFVYLGFRPKFIMIKDTTNVQSWNIIDSARVTYNVDNMGLYPNLANAESANLGLDLLSNGFKFRTDGTTNGNASGATYIYMAFAENPTKFSNAR